MFDIDVTKAAIVDGYYTRLQKCRTPRAKAKLRARHKRVKQALRTLVAFI